MARVIVISGIDCGLEYQINQEIIIGRHGENDIPLADIKASRRHGLIFCEQERYYLKDMGSRNGLQLNGNSIKHSELSPGDKITIGNTNMVFYQNDTTPSLEDILRKFGYGRAIKSKSTPPEIKRSVLCPKLKDQKLGFRVKSFLRAYFALISEHALVSKGVSAVLIVISMIVIIAVSRWLTLWLLN